jgi:GT2 family glycosyltransferase
VLPKLYTDVKVLRNEVNSGFIKSVNRGIQAATGDLVLLLNNDVEINNAGWLAKLIKGMEAGGFDMCAPAGGNLDRHYNYVPGESKKAGDHFTYLPFWCCLIKKAVIDTVGLLDEDYGAGFWDDVDYNFRAKKAGFKLGIVELPEVKHAYHQTFLKSGINIQKQYQTNRAVFLSKWGIV